MHRPAPFTGKAEKLFELDMTLWGLKLLWRKLRTRPGGALAGVRGLLATGRTTRIYMSKLKPVRFGRDVKMGMYLPRWPSQALAARVGRALNGDGRHPHEQVMLAVTDACPYRCPHCFNSRKSQTPMPVRRFRELVGEIQQVGGSWLCIHGGEPLVDMERTMAVAESADGRSEVWVATTGFGLDAATARQLKQAGLFGACVSLHHYVPEEHDAFVRYPGAFGIAVEAIEHFSRAGVMVILNTTLTPERITHEEIRRMMELGKDLGAGMVDILFVRPGGRAVVGCDQLLPEPPDKQVLEDAMETFNRDPAFGEYPALAGPPYFEDPDRFGCVAGNERVFISAAGDVQPCAMVNLSVGNVARESFATVTSRLHRLLPCPRRDLVCTHLQPIVSQRIGSAGEAELPLKPEVSLEMLRALPDSPPPGAYAKREPAAKGNRRRAAGQAAASPRPASAEGR